MSYDRSDQALAYTVPFQLTKKIHRSVPDALQPETKEAQAAAQGKIVVITGGGTGIGAASAKVWVRAGAAGVVIAGRRQEKLDETVCELEKLKKTDTIIFGVSTDVKLEASVDNLFKQVNKRFNRPADVVFANAGVVTDPKPLTEETVERWWNVYEINVLGAHNTVRSWINSQPDPSKPVGTIINVNTGLAGFIAPGMSAYSTSKLAAHRYMEYVAAEFPSLRTFTLLPGIVATDMATEATDFAPYAKDEGEQTGALGLYLASSRGDWLNGSLTSVNWDLEEMEAHKDKIADGMLKIKWVPVLPCSGGEGI
ncbi:uncharacterized protein LTR77_003909 [Saxophila tyrrhenica]|uniref:NAD(P)-binding protein n=1 Tax=Saxophila tyrrhenica TaxID=1690608 RepID=A0AAV9PHZ0_9PEZI|nr:hypothetical protein LTR77_003909 [Saxophila tyrrhenica]